MTTVPGASVNAIPTRTSASAKSTPPNGGHEPHRMAKALVLPHSVLPPETFGIFASHERTRDVKDDRPLPQQRGEKQEADQTGAGSAPSIRRSGSIARRSG